MRGIDLYAGVGGWSTGLKLAGIDVVASYERWHPACITNSLNNGHEVKQVDIRQLDPSSLPADIQVVVGSPPCTQFSFSNKGGKGDIADGILDIVRFLEVVDHIRPLYWVFENVPRIAKILAAHFSSGGLLERFSHLSPRIYLMDGDHFGLPQRRRRCLVGNIDFALLDSYKSVAPRRTLGDVVRSLQSEQNVVDPIYNITVSRAELTDHRTDDFLSEEEARINATSKLRHLVYNTMTFPDDLERPSRTITATCSHVSRESIVVRAGKDRLYRRLSIRERASVQGFPINFQFMADFYGQKLTMAGNAFPPLLSYLVGQALNGTQREYVVPPAMVGDRFRSPDVLSKTLAPRQANPKFAASRRFRFAIPSLQLKSGVRFELANIISPTNSCWTVRFIFGTPSSIQTVGLHRYARAGTVLREFIGSNALLFNAMSRLRDFASTIDEQEMQRVWSHHSNATPGPFEVLDYLSVVGASTAELLQKEKHAVTLNALIDQVLSGDFGERGSGLPGVPRLHRHANIIAAGLIVAHTFNSSIEAARSGSSFQTSTTARSENPSLCAAH